MTQARFDLDDYSMRILDVVKGKYGLKNRNEALRMFLREHGAQYAEVRLDEQIIERLDKIANKHAQQHAHRKMSDDELDELLGL